jgi:hypothetical protein
MGVCFGWRLWWPSRFSKPRFRQQPGVVPSPTRLDALRHLGQYPLTVDDVERRDVVPHLCLGLCRRRWWQTCTRVKIKAWTNVDPINPELIPSIDISGALCISPSCSDHYLYHSLETPQQVHLLTPTSGSTGAHHSQTLCQEVHLLEVHQAVEERLISLMCERHICQV